MIQTLTLNVNIPDNYEATGEFRYPTEGEPFLTSSGTAQVCHDNDQCGRKMNRIILRKKWALPDWFRPGWVLKSLSDHYWVQRTGQSNAVCAPALWNLHDDVFVPPPLGNTCPIRKM